MLRTEMTLQQYNAPDSYTFDDTGARNIGKKIS